MWSAAVLRKPQRISQWQFAPGASLPYANVDDRMKQKTRDKHVFYTRVIDSYHENFG